MDFIVETSGVDHRGVIRFEDGPMRAITFPCALGRNGVTLDKREGDGATPLGRFPCRRIYYRPDRIERPVTSLPVIPVQESDGWCDDPMDPCYNRPVDLPYPGRHERLWRMDHLYDIILVIGHNDDPARSGKGSAIFIHLPQTNYGPTEGCVALAHADMLRLLQILTPGSHVTIRKADGEST